MGPVRGRQALAEGVWPRRPPLLPGLPAQLPEGVAGAPLQPVVEMSTLGNGSHFQRSPRACGLSLMVCSQTGLLSRFVFLKRL